MVRRPGIEPGTDSLENCCSIRLSYLRKNWGASCPVGYD